jgi:hypothetical protein
VDEVQNPANLECHNHRQNPLETTNWAKDMRETNGTFEEGYEADADVYLCNS